MPQLRSHRRDRRARAPKIRRRRNLVKFVPNGDSDFAHTARNFATYITRDQSAYQLNDDDVAAILNAVNAYRSALHKALQKRTANPQTIDAKKIARRHAEGVVRRYANIIRANPDVSGHHKKLLRIKERPARLKARKCPHDPPELHFVGSGDGTAGGAAVAIGGGCGVHVLKFYQYEPWTGKRRKSKPDGAVRIELFVDFVLAGEAPPKSPFDRVREGRGFPWYLRSFTKSPIEVEFPLPSEPMLVVYWARWADSAGNVSRFSRTCMARLEGWTKWLPAERMIEGKDALEGVRYVIVEEVARAALPSGSEDDVFGDVLMLPERESSGIAC